MQKTSEWLVSWWIEANGTGTDACSACRPPVICAWHQARLEEIEARIAAERAEADLLARIDEQRQLTAVVKRASGTKPEVALAAIVMAIQEFQEQRIADLYPGAALTTQTTKEQEDMNHA